MALGFYKNVLDFEILETGNDKTLVFVDSSQYIKPPEEPILEVIMPGFSKCTIAGVVPNVVNTFNSSTLNINKAFSDVDLLILPDGIWTLSYKICPYEYINVTKSFLRITILNNKLRQVYNNVNLLECESKFSDYISHQIVKINMLIEGAKAAVSYDNKKAYNYYQTANKMVDELLRKHCQNCKTEI